MNTLQKEKLFDYTSKTIITLLVVYVLYNIADIFFISRQKEEMLALEIGNTINIIESNIGRSYPENPEDKEEAGWRPSEKSTLIWPEAKRNIFTGRHIVKPIPDSEADRLNITEMELSHEELAPEAKPESAERHIKLHPPAQAPIEPEPYTEITFKGATEGLALINVRKKIGEIWYGYGFPTKEQSRIGNKKIIKGKNIDLSTNYILIEILNKAERKSTLMKKAIVFDGNGKFAGTKMVPGEAYIITEPKIIYTDEEGNKHELWIGQTAVLTGGGK